MSLLYNPSVDKRGSRYGDEGTRADIFENEAILMTHNSARYSPETAKDIVMKRIPDVLRGRVHVLPNTRAFRPSAPPTAAAKQ